jgi:hypothetical protein
MLGMLMAVIIISYAARMLSVHLLFTSVSNLKTHALLVVLTTALLGNLLYLCIMYLFNLEEIQGIKRYVAGKTYGIF